MIIKSKKTCKDIFVYIKNAKTHRIFFFIICFFLKDLVVYTQNKTHFYIILKWCHAIVKMHRNKIKTSKKILAKTIFLGRI